MKKLTITFLFIICILGLLNTISASNTKIVDNSLSISVNPVTRDCYWLFDGPGFGGDYQIYDCMGCYTKYVENPRIQMTCTWPPF